MSANNTASCRTLFSSSLYARIVACSGGIYCACVMLTANLHCLQEAAGLSSQSDRPECTNLSTTSSTQSSSSGETISAVGGQVQAKLHPADVQAGPTSTNRFNGSIRSVSKLAQHSLHVIGRLLGTSHMCICILDQFTARNGSRANESYWCVAMLFQLCQWLSKRYS